MLVNHASLCVVFFNVYVFPVYLIVDSLTEYMSIVIYLFFPAGIKKELAAAKKKVGRL